MRPSASAPLRRVCVAMLGGCSALVAAQPLYKVITPDGKITYTDKPPPSAQANVRELPAPPGPPPAGVPGQVAPGPAPDPAAAGGMGRMGPPGVPLVALPPAPRPAPQIPLTARRGTPAMSKLSECLRNNRQAISLMRAAEDVVRAVGRTNAPSAFPAYQAQMLANYWKAYKSLGGTAESPEQVRVPDNPCRDAEQALNQQTAVLEEEFRKCVAQRPAEVRLSALSKEVVTNRAFIGALEKVQTERRRNPNFDAQNKGGEWAAAFKADPALARVSLERQFQEYRNAGGKASRVEDVTEIPHPCMPAENAAPSGPSPIRATRSRPATGP